MSILTKKKNGSNHKAKTISIPRKKQNMHKTRKNIGKSRKNMGVKTMRGGLKILGLKFGKDKVPKVKSVEVPSVQKIHFEGYKTNPLYNGGPATTKSIYSVAGKPNPLGGTARKVGLRTALNFSPPKLLAPMLPAQLSTKIVRESRPLAFKTTLPMTQEQLSSMQTTTPPTSALIMSAQKSPTANPSNKIHPQTFATRAEMEQYAAKHKDYNNPELDPHYH